MRAAPQSVRAIDAAPAARGRQKDDALEREADHIADTVVKGRFTERTPHVGAVSGQGTALAEAPLAVRQVLAQSGEPLGRTERSYFEPRFGRDLGGIQVHRDAAAERSADAIAAQAYAYGSHIVFGRGAYDPSTQAGRHLVAHELSHTMQQLKGGMASIQRKPRADAAEEDKDKPAIVSVSAEQGAKTADVLMSDGSSATVELVINKLAPGDYTTSLVGRVRGATLQGIPGKFIYRYPVDPYTEELLNGLAPKIEVHIRATPTPEIRQLPDDIRNFVTSDRARPGTAD